MPSFHPERPSFVRKKARALQKALTDLGSARRLTDCQSALARIYGFHDWRDLTRFVRLATVPSKFDHTVRKEDVSLLQELLGIDRSVATAALRVATPRGPLSPSAPNDTPIAAWMVEHLSSIQVPNPGPRRKLSLVEKERFHRTLTRQIGDRWTSVDDLDDVQRAVIAVLLSGLLQDDEGAHLLADPSQRFQPSDEAVRAAVRGILDRKDARELIDATSRRHAFFSTMTMALVRKSKESNVFPRHALDWLRQADRHEYRIVIWIRSSVASFETVAVRSHYHREIEGGNAIPVPDLEPVLRTIEERVADCLEPALPSPPMRIRVPGHEWIELA